MGSQSWTRLSDFHVFLNFLEEKKRAASLKPGTHVRDFRLSQMSPALTLLLPLLCPWLFGALSPDCSLSRLFCSELGLVPSCSELGLVPSCSGTISLALRQLGPPGGEGQRRNKHPGWRGAFRNKTSAPFP